MIILLEYMIIFSQNNFVKIESIHLNGVQIIIGYFIEIMKNL